jgi:hypothetical protein
MYILFTDETNMPQDPGAKFFVYGGLFFPVERLVDLHEGIERIRRESGYRAGDELKFQTNARPDWVSVEQAREAKSRVVKQCIDLECQFIVYIVLHAIARNRTHDELVRWGADHVFGKFNYFLALVGDHGIVAVDRLPIVGDYRYLSERFCTGLEYADGKRVPLDRIKLLTATCINASHASSAMDIVLGSFRYCINQPKNLEVAREMMINVTKLVWAKREGDNIIPWELGLVFRPVYPDIKVASYRMEYDRLVEHINTLLGEVRKNP